MSDEDPTIRVGGAHITTIDQYPGATGADMLGHVVKQMFEAIGDELERRRAQPLWQTLQMEWRPEYLPGDRNAYRVGVTLLASTPKKETPHG